MHTAIERTRARVAMFNAGAELHLHTIRWKETPRIKAPKTFPSVDR